MGHLNLNRISYISGMDKVVVTPQGETPPQIGTPFYEAPDSRKTYPHYTLKK
jgi:hypothetical protein